MPADPSTNPHSPDPLSGLNPARLLQQGLPTDAATQARHDAWQPLPVDEVQALLPAFEVHELIGRGGMGAVYKARQLALDRLVAIKILPPQVGRDPAFAERFAREAKALARLSHPRIVAIHDAGTAPLPGSSDKLYFFVMEFVDGASLRAVMHEGKLPPADALAIVPQICEALQYAHDEGVMHRDIKPDNILLDSRGRVKIADFGLAKLLGLRGNEVTLTGTHQVMGSVPYMAPEQMSGTREIDHRADIYSLGVVFYELLTGEVPHGPFEPPSHLAAVDSRVDNVVLRSLAREPAKRYQQAGEVKTDIDTIAQQTISRQPTAQQAAVTPTPSSQTTFAPEPKPAPVANFSEVPPPYTTSSNQSSTTVLVVCALLAIPLLACGLGCLGLVGFSLSHTSVREHQEAIPTPTVQYGGVSSIHDGQGANVLLPAGLELQSGGTMRDVVATKDGKYVVAADQEGLVVIQDQFTGSRRLVHLLQTSGNRFWGLHCLALSHDDKHVFAAGQINSDRFGRIFKVRLDDGSFETIPIEMPTAPVIIRHVKPWFEGPAISCVIGDTTFGLFDLQGNKQTTADIYPGKVFGNVRAMASSPAGEFTAVTSSNMVADGEGMKSGDPYQLTVFDLNGKETLQWRFADGRDFTRAQVVFADDETLLVAIPSGQLLRWKLDGEKETWESQPAVRIAPGSYLASALSADGKAIWLAVDRQLWCFDHQTGNGVAWAELEIGGRLGTTAQDPVQAIAPLADGEKIAAALWDGRVQIANVTTETPPTKSTEKP
jgi:serine/threonine protein kinase